MRRSPADDGDAKFALQLFVVLAVACGLAWAAGQLAGLLFAQAWLRLGLVDLPWIFYGWIRNWRDPALAWPVPAREMLPGPLGCTSAWRSQSWALWPRSIGCGCVGYALAPGARPAPRSGRHAGRSAAWQCVTQWAGCRICGRQPRAAGRCSWRL